MYRRRRLLPPRRYHLPDALDERLGLQHHTGKRLGDSTHIGAFAQNGSLWKSERPLCSQAREGLRSPFPAAWEVSRVLLGGFHPVVGIIPRSARCEARSSRVRRTSLNLCARRDFSIVGPARPFGERDLLTPCARRARRRRVAREQEEASGMRARAHVGSWGVPRGIARRDESVTEVTALAFETLYSRAARS